MNKKIIGRVNAQRKKEYPNLDLLTSQHLAGMTLHVSAKVLKREKMKEIYELIALWLVDELKTKDFDFNEFLAHLLDYQVSNDITTDEIFKTVSPMTNYRESQLTVSKKWLPVGVDKIGMRPVPVVTMSGYWLAAFGFETGELCKVMAQDGSILIQTIASHG